MSEQDKAADSGIGIGGNADETPARGRGGAMSGETQHEEWAPIADVDGAIRGLESVLSMLVARAYARCPMWTSPRGVEG